MDLIDSPLSARFEVNEAARTIRGLAVPYGVAAFSNGRRFQFSRGTLTYADVSRVKVLVGHDFTRAVGVATELEDTDEGLFITARIAKGAAGDEVLNMAAEGVWDGLSIGLGQGGQFRAEGGINHAVTAPLIEVSVTPVPSFDSARIQAVAASAATNRKDSPMGDENTTEVETPPGLDFSAITDAIRDGFANLTPPAIPPREPLGQPAGQLEVNEEAPYRFDGIAGAHGFLEDIQSSLFSGDSEARQRLEGFMAEAFAPISSANVATLNPTQNRPELYVPQLQYTRPLWDAVTTGSITDKTPFTFPKFGTATNLTAPHVEGVEPAEGTFTVTSQTVTPGAVSGKVVLPRELVDQGGNPQVDTLIWNEMVASYWEGVEAKINTALAAVATAELNLAGAVDEALIDAIQNYLTALQFVRGGNRFTGLVLDGLLFPALTNASDTSGRKLLPVINATNAQGETSAGFDAVKIGNLTGRAAWALGATNASKSYNFVPSSVYAWASAPKRFNFEYQVSTVTLAVWGYTAAAVTRDSDVKPIDYTTADA